MMTVTRCRNRRHFKTASESKINKGLARKQLFLYSHFNEPLTEINLVFY